MAQTKVKLISDGVIVQGNLHASHGITTAHIGEGSNLYYTDVRVGSYLSTNSFATESYVGTQIANLVDSSPEALNTLNELAAALGDDANFSTTVTNSIALKAPLASPSFTGNATFAGNITGGTTIGTAKIIMQGDGTLDWGNVKDYGTLTWDTGYAIIAGQASKGLKLRTNDSTDALTIDTSQNATFTGSVNINSNETLNLKNADNTNGFQIYNSGATGSTNANLIFLSGAVGERMRIDSSGGVSITPTTSTSFFYGADGTNSYINFETNNINATVQLYAGYSSGGYFAIGTKNSGGTLAERMRIDSSGITTIKRTGITGVAKNDMILQIGYEGNNGQNNLIGFGYNGGTNIPAYIGYTTTNGGGSTQGDLVFATRGVTTDSAPTERMRIDSSGNVGINATAYLGFNGAGDPSHSVAYNAGIDGVQLRGQNGLIFGTGGGATAVERMRIDSSGAINIGTRRAAIPSTFGYSSGYKTLILGSTGTTYVTDAVTLCFGVDVSANASGSFNGNGREYIFRNEGSFITPNVGNNGFQSILNWTSGGYTHFASRVGIGTTSPNTKLDVSGATGTRNRSTTGGSSVYETSKYFGVNGNSTANISINTVTEFPPMGSGGFILVEVSASGYGNSGSNGLVFSYITGGYGGHYAAVNQPYHPVQITANTMQAGTCTWYNPSADVIGITITTTNSAGINGLMRVKVTTTY